MRSAGRKTTPRQFRIIAYDYKQSLGDAASYAAFHANLERQIAAAASHISVDPPTLAFLPEDTGLMAWFIGAPSVGGPAAPAVGWDAPGWRKAIAAAAALGSASDPRAAYYRRKYPGIPLQRCTFLALTDTAWRAFGEGLAGIAARRRLWIIANLNAPDITVTRDPAKVAVLADPARARRGYAYEGGCEVWNTAFLFRPDATLDCDGAANPADVLFDVRKKVYLVPDERNPAVLAMSSESPANARVITLPFARLGVLTSKDAWMSDIVERLEIDGMDVFLQPEAGEWAGRDPKGLPIWPPDAMTRAIWSMVQWQAETSRGALSNLIGNLTGPPDHYFDGTATITRDARPREVPKQFLLGRLRQRGIVTRRPWMFPDPPKGIAFEDVHGRRKFLDAQGALLQPGSHDPLENAQRGGFVVADIKLPPLGPVGTRLRAGQPSVPIAPAAGAQWEPALAVGSKAAGPRGAVIYATWTDLRDGFESPYVGRSTNGGVQWCGPWKAGDSVSRPLDQQDNQYNARLAVAPDGTLHLVWAYFLHQSWDIYAARSVDGGETWSRSVRVDHSPCSGENFPQENLHQGPVVAALPDGTLVAAWSDARGMRVDRNLMAARSCDGGATWVGDVQADGSGTLEADQWAPAIAAFADGRIALAWQDQITGWNQIFMAFSTDNGKTFSRAIRVARSPAQQWQPAIAVDTDGGVGVAWAEGTGGGERRIRVAIVKGGKTKVFLADASAPHGVRQARPAIVYGGGAFWVAWQDDRAGDWDVLVARANGVRSRPRRVDDSPPGTHARLPALAVDGDRLVVAWEDTRDGREQIRTTVLSLKKMLRSAGGGRRTATVWRTPGRDERSVTRARE